jgi:hypothetical protein
MKRLEYFFDNIYKKTFDAISQITKNKEDNLELKNLYENSFGLLYCTHAIIDMFRFADDELKKIIKNIMIKKDKSYGSKFIN